MYFSIILIALLWSKITSATVGLAWQFPNSSRLRAGLKDITFPFDMSKAPHKDGLYFAQQFFFEDYKENGYTGLQPRPDDGAGSVIHAVFSSFIEEPYEYGVCEGKSAFSTHSIVDGFFVESGF
ncbi:hypothetical protein V2A60_000886 [Cordyceps javanica]